MKFKIFTLGLLIILSCSLSAQEKRSMKRSIGFTFSAFDDSNSNVIHSKILDGGASYSCKKVYTFGVSYIHPIRPWIDIESGIEYSNHTITVKPMTMPDMEYSYSEYDKDISLINIPVTARINFLKYLFFNGGTILDLEVGSSSPINNQTGLGVLFGIGAKYNLNNGIGAFINGYSKIHSLVSFSSDYHYRRLIDGGLRIGIMYSF